LEKLLKILPEVFLPNFVPLNLQPKILMVMAGQTARNYKIQQGFEKPAMPHPEF